MPRAHRRVVFVISMVAVAMARGQSLHAQPRVVPAALVGEWVFRMEGDRQPQRVTLRASADTLRGAVYGQEFVGTVSGARLTFSVGDFRWRGDVIGDSISGWLGIAPDSSRWSARRFRLPANGRRYDHAPTAYHRALGTPPPALRLYPGDTVHTSTVDAGGWGRGAFGDRRNKLSDGGNPLTGPFLVEGAVPGDVLVVRLLRVRLDRGWGFSGTSLIDDAIEPSYAVDRKPSQIGNKWVLDTIAGVAKLQEPPPALREFSVPLRPFLGVVAVAPGDGVVPSSRESGRFGGNMEYAQLREGATLYLPVTELGAWLYLGDGHAAQGDGELTGDAIETSMDVTFSVDVQRWRFRSVPRAETVDDIMSIGTGGTLDQAMRQATSDLARWLESDYGLTSSEAAIVMGFAVKYDVPDLVPSQVGVVARLPKSALTSLRRRP